MGILERVKNTETRWPNFRYVICKAIALSHIGRDRVFPSPSESNLENRMFRKSKFVILMSLSMSACNNRSRNNAAADLERSYPLPMISCEIGDDYTTFGIAEISSDSGIEADCVYYARSSRDPWSNEVGIEELSYNRKSIRFLLHSDAIPPAGDYQVGTPPTQMDVHLSDVPGFPEGTLKVETKENQAVRFEFDVAGTNLEGTTSSAMGFLEVPTLDPKSAASAGGLTSEEIKAVVNANLFGIRQCYETSLETVANLAGVVVTAFVIGDDGKVVRPNIIASEARETTLHGCLRSRISKWDFPKPREADEVYVRFPFSFNLIGDEARVAIEPIAP